MTRERFKVNETYLIEVNSDIVDAFPVLDIVQGIV